MLVASGYELAGSLGCLIVIDIYVYNSCFIEVYGVDFYDHVR